MKLSDTTSLEDEGTERALRAIQLRSPIARQAAIYALRMVDGNRWLPRLLDRNGDCRALELIGLTQRNPRARMIVLADLRESTEVQRKRLERRMPRCPDLLTRNIDTLSESLRLNATERALLRLAVVARVLPR